MPYLHAITGRWSQVTGRWSQVTYNRPINVASLDAGILLRGASPGGIQVSVHYTTRRAVTCTPAVALPQYPHTPPHWSTGVLLALRFGVSVSILPHTARHGTAHTARQQSGTYHRTTVSPLHRSTGAMPLYLHAGMVLQLQHSYRTTRYHAHCSATESPLHRSTGVIPLYAPFVLSQVIDRQV